MTSENADASQYIHVVAAAILNLDQQQVLITRRAVNAHQGGKWEFPGGKVERGESPAQALCRELNEELGIMPVAHRPLIKTRYEYSDKRVLLEVWRIERYTGVPEGREGQPLRWVALANLGKISFPKANLPIVTALRLPERYLITPDPREDWPEYLNTLRRALEQGQVLLRFRANTLSDESYARHAAEFIALCHDHGTCVLIDRRPEWVNQLGADGLHLTSRILMRLNDRPIGPDQLLCASCHNREELVQAHRIDADFVVLSPVNPTESHPTLTGLGWQVFAALCDIARMPVYALGGMSVDDLSKIWQCGGQGIAAIRSLWPSKLGSSR